jgi:hypothetical protein
VKKKPTIVVVDLVLPTATDKDCPREAAGRSSAAGAGEPLPE